MSRAKLILVRFLVLLDCVLNRLLKGSINETLSARAHRMRVKHQPYWWWLADAIDAVFFWQTGHCLTSHQREVTAGGALMWLPQWLRPGRLWPAGALPV